MNSDNIFLTSDGTHINGNNFSVVIIDTGIDLDHPHFGPDSDGDGIADRIVYQYDFSGTDDDDATDFNSHGSHVAGIAASSDATYPGIAPGANIIALKVFPDSGSGSFSDIDEALDWVIENAEAYNIASVNMSLSNGTNNIVSTAAPFISNELQALADKNIIVVSAAGNSGADGVSSPAADPNSLAVSSVNSNGSISSFSQHHPILTDVFAPGSNIRAANQNGGTTTKSGTSMAAPHVAGAMVIAQQLAEQELGRRLTLDEIRGLLTQGDDVANEPDYQGKLLNVTKLGEAILEMAPYDPSTHLTLDVNNSAQFGRLLSYGGIEENYQPEQSTVEITDNGNVLTLMGNTWTKVPINYEITENTVIEFNFESTQQGEIHAIGFDNDNMLNSNTHFQFFGTETWVGAFDEALPDFDIYTENSGVNNYRIEVGKHLTLGEYEFLTFAADHDVASPDAVSIFSDIKIYEFEGTPEPPPETLPPLQLTVTVGEVPQQIDLESYGGETENTNLEVTLNQGEDGLDMVGNGWQKILIDYNITENTMLKFDFQSTSEGEIHGIGFDNNDLIRATDEDNFFQVYGTEDWGRNDVNIDNYNPVDGIKTYDIDVGTYLSGQQFNYLTFAQDDDLNQDAVSQISNIQLYEFEEVVEENPSQLIVTVEGTEQPFDIESYGGTSQDVDVQVVLDQNGKEVDLIGNGWKQIQFESAYTVTANTVLEFNFNSSQIGDIHGIGFDNDNNISSNQTFQLYGTQNWGINAFKDYQSSDGIKSYTIRVGDYFTGDFTSLFFVNDHDVSMASAVSEFSNIKIYEAETLSNESELNDEQVDTLIGTDESDIFSLGNSHSPLYDENGDQDYALIQGFDVTEDIIELHGEESDYFFSPSSGDLGNGTSIFLQTEQGHDLLGIVENVNALSFENYADNFAFV